MIALEDVDLSVAAGELIALLGPSGCGKTTMLQIIAGFLRPTSGEVKFDGARVGHIPANRRRIGMVFQNYALFPHLTVFENVATDCARERHPAPRSIPRSPKCSISSRCRAFAARLPGQLSGGQQQRVALARALAIEPGLVLLDEPFSALDKNLRLDMQIEIKSLLKSFGVTSIIVTHDQEGGALDGGPDRRPQQGTRRTGRQSRRALRPTRKPVRQQLHRACQLSARHHVGRRSGQARRWAGNSSWPSPPSAWRGTAVTVSVRPENIALVAPETPGAIPITVRVTDAARRHQCDRGRRAERRGDQGEPGAAGRSSKGSLVRPSGCRSTTCPA
jgi:putative spermidine/putrescine transport system ATP-binding protein